jgi:hypothetical protein
VRRCALGSRSSSNLMVTERSSGSYGQQILDGGLRGDAGVPLEQLHGDLARRWKAAAWSTPVTPLVARTPGLRVAPGQPNHRTFNQWWKVRMLAGWGHLRGPAPALSSMNGSERRSRQLDSLRTLVTHPGRAASALRHGEPCRVGECQCRRGPRCIVVAGGCATSDRRWSCKRLVGRMRASGGQARAARAPGPALRRGSMRERCGTGEHGGRPTHCGASCGQGCGEARMGRVQRISKVHSPPWWVTWRSGGLPAGH